LLALQAGVSLGLAVVAACVVVVLAALKNREIGANTSPAAYRVSGAKGAPISPSRMD